MGYRLGDTEVLGILGNTHLHFLAGAKEMINRIPAGKDHPGVVWNLDLLFAEIPCRYTFQTDEMAGKSSCTLYFAEAQSTVTYHSQALGWVIRILCIRFGLIAGLVNPIFIMFGSAKVGCKVKLFS